ncbi:anti-sigma factor RsbA family regulatory protein [Nocardiopsis kunsanensis]|uniref:Anti-sigma regulatory factor n=1 Tax=Nocardiopsis kunsanensis TaxID=141693 RepID=A0A918XBR4_9ACTN|nr:anti-sigma factor RsbA family regulatory protein [Nocardiopsis kunsanensis]GHD23895.1 anti-sigma regulatory factor [Nocardiopsis kunsanensis]
MTFMHQGLLFAHEHRFRAVAGGWLQTAVASGRPAVLAVAPHRSARLLAALPPRVAHEVRVLDRDTLYDAPGRMLAALHRLVLAHAPARVTVVAEPPSGNGPDPAPREWRRLEAVLSTALDGSALDLLCVHDICTLSAAARTTVHTTHPVLIGAGGPHANHAYLGPGAHSARSRSPSPLPLTGPVHRVEIGQSLPRLRRELTALGASLELDPVQADGLVVAVNELAANVLEHGAGKGSISLWRSYDRWVCEVFDEAGLLTDPLAGYRPADDLRSRGYGLWITRQTCDFLEICGDSCGSLVRLHFLDRSTEPEPSARDTRISR